MEKRIEAERNANERAESKIDEKPESEEEVMSTHALEIIAVENEKRAPRKELRVYFWTCLFFAGMSTLALYVMFTFPAFEL